MKPQRHGHSDDEVDFAKAKALSVNAFIQQDLRGKPSIKKGWMRYSVCPACGEGPKLSVRLAVHPDDSSWTCHRCGKGGSIIDAGMFLWGCSALEAVKKLLGITESGPRKVAAEYDHAAEEAERKRRLVVMREAFCKLQEACQSFRDDENCLRYLSVKRAIPVGVIREAQMRGMVGFMPSNHDHAKRVMVEALGKDLMQEAGLWKPDKRLPGIAYRPLVFFMPGMAGAEFRTIVDVPEGWSKSIAYGLKDYPYWWAGTEPKCLITEGLIDLLSAVALGFRGHIMGVPGCKSMREEWLEKSAERYSIRKFIIGLDNDVDHPDNPGQAAAREIAEMLQKRNLPHCINAPERGDINDILRARTAS